MATHDTQVTRQFGPQAAAYLHSAVHAQGEDLQRVAASFAGRPQARVLDLGCGAGHLGFAIAPQVAAVVACDPSEQMLGVVAAAARERGLANLRTQACRAEELPFPDASFDAVVTRFSAHHWGDVPRALAETRRVLVAGGRLDVIDIAAPESPLLDTHLQAAELLRDLSHVRDYRISEWQAMLRQAGFTADAPRGWRLRMAFDEWIARMRTPPERAAATRALLLGAPQEVREHFAVEPDGSFQIDAVAFEAVRAGN